MQHYPLLLRLTHMAVVIVGLGAVGKRKLVSILAASPYSITLIDPTLSQPDKQNEILRLCAPYQYQPIMLAKKFDASASKMPQPDLVFAATDVRSVNNAIAEYCKKNHILCNIADAEEESDFIIPAHIQRDPISISIATGGASPALTKRLREDIEKWLGERYSKMAIFMGRIRPHVLRLNAPSQENAELFRVLVYSPLIDYLEQHNIEAASKLLRSLLPMELHQSIEEFLHDL